MKRWMLICKLIHIVQIYNYLSFKKINQRTSPPFRSFLPSYASSFHPSFLSSSASGSEPFKKALRLIPSMPRGWSSAQLYPYSRRPDYVHTCIYAYVYSSIYLFIYLPFYKGIWEYENMKTYVYRCVWSVTIYVIWWSKASTIYQHRDLSKL